MSPLVEIFRHGRTDEQMAKDGASAALSQIAALRRQLDRLERCCKHVIKTGAVTKADGVAWRQTAKAADALLEGMI